MVWALVLAILAFANLLFLSTVVQMMGTDDGPGQSQIWLVFLLNVLFLIGFAVSAYGLFRLDNWGRILFLWCIIIWSGFNLIAIFIPSFYPDRDRSAEGVWFNGLRYGVGLIVPLWYLNLPRIKMIFHSQRSENLIVEETKDDDNIS